MILDASTVSAILEGNEEIDRILVDAEVYWLPIPVVGEYLFGIRGSKRQRKLSTGFEALLEASRLQICDFGTAEIYAEVRQELKRIGKPIPENDMWIAALARQHQLEIVSRDVHFDAVPGITRIAW